MATIFRSPILNSIPKLPSLQPDVVENLLPLYFAPNPSRPWHQDDWPLCVKANPPQDSFQPANRFPYINPNPTRPWHQDDWPSVQPIPKPQPSDAPANRFPYINPNPTRPWHADDWPLAVKVPLSLKSDSYGEILPLLQPNPSKPFHQDDWPRAWEPKPPQKSDAASEMFPLRQPNPTRPWHEDQWPLATRGKPPQESDAASEMFPLRRPNPAQPFHADDWPSALSVERGAIVDWPVRFPGLFPAVVVTPSPFYQTAWPRAADPRPVAILDYSTSGLALTQPNPTRPFHADDWPNSAPVVNGAIMFDAPNTLNTVITPPVVVTPPTPTPTVEGGGGGRLPKRLRKYLYGKKVIYSNDREELRRIVENLIATAASRKAAADNAGPAAIKLPPVKVETGTKEYVQMFAMAPAFMTNTERGDFRSALLALSACKAQVDQYIREAMELAIEMEDEEFLLMIH